MEVLEAREELEEATSAEQVEGLRQTNHGMSLLSLGPISVRDASKSRSHSTYSPNSRQSATLTRQKRSNLRSKISKAHSRHRRPTLISPRRSLFSFATGLAWRRLQKSGRLGKAQDRVPDQALRIADSSSVSSESWMLRYGDIQVLEILIGTRIPTVFMYLQSNLGRPHGCNSHM